MPFGNPDEIDREWESELGKPGRVFEVSEQPKVRPRLWAMIGGVVGTIIALVFVIGVVAVVLVGIYKLLEWMIAL